MKSEIIYERVVVELIGKTIPPGETKLRGQELEGIILNQLGYDYTKGELLEGGYPDIRHQLLEVKIQDTQTVDLGRYTPQTVEIIHNESGISTQDIRYLFAMTNSTSGVIEGVILSPGLELGNSFKYVDGVSGKCQRSIRMSVFDQYKGKSLFNP